MGKQNLAYIANWPDFVKSDTLNTYKETEVWHYVNVKPNQNFTEFEIFKKNLILPIFTIKLLSKRNYCQQNSSKKKKFSA